MSSLTIKKVDRLFKGYGVSGGLLTVVATYAAFFSEKLFVVPAIDAVLLEKLLVLGFGICFGSILYIFKYFERKRPIRRGMPF